MKRLICVLLFVVGIATALAEPTPQAVESKLDLDQLFGLNAKELARYAIEPDKNYEISNWKGFRKVVFGFNESRKLQDLKLILPSAVGETEAKTALEAAFKLDLASAKLLPQPWGLRFERVSPKIKSISIFYVDKRSQLHVCTDIVIKSVIHD